MLFHADFEVISDVTVTEGKNCFYFSHPRGRFKCKLSPKQIDSIDGRQLHLFQMTFNSSNLEASKDVAMVLLNEAMSALALVTNSEFQFHKLIQIFDWSSQNQMKHGIVYSTSPVQRELTPLLGQGTRESVESLLMCFPSTGILDATRWFRLAIVSKTPDEQFQNFWFCIELVASENRSLVKVNDRCAKCQSPLYCETCKDHPKHRPYPKQAIEQLFIQFAKNGAELFKVLSQARNIIMHGGTLLSAEKTLNSTTDNIVNAIGQIAWRALIQAQFNSTPNTIRELRPELYTVNQYVAYNLNAAARIETAVRKLDDGFADFSNGPAMSVTIERGASTSRD